MDPYTLEQIKNHLKEWEGCILKRYKCVGNEETIGYGHKVRREDKIPDEIVAQEAEALLEEDIWSAYDALRRLVKVSLYPGQEVALISFIFNVGAGAFQRSILRSKVNRRAHDEVPVEFLKWIWAGGRPHRGLLRRRQEEARIYSSRFIIEGFSWN